MGGTMSRPIVTAPILPTFISLSVPGPLAYQALNELFVSRVDVAARSFFESPVFSLDGVATNPSC